MPRTFYVPRCLHPGYSLLGRWIRSVVGDERRAEARLVVAATGLALGVLLVHYLAWTLASAGGPAVLAGPAAAAVFVLTCLVGFKPPIRVTCRPDHLRLEQGARVLVLPYEAIQAAEPLSALQFHRHYRRYAGTHVFVNRVERGLLLMRTASGPVVLGLAPADGSALLAYLRTRQAPYAVDLSPSAG